VHEIDDLKQHPNAKEIYKDTIEIYKELVHLHDNQLHAEHVYVEDKVDQQTWH
jgi:hypothetical protein